MPKTSRLHRVRSLPITSRLHRIRSLPIGRRLPQGRSVQVGRRLLQTRSQQWAKDAGMVTAETAVLLPALVLVLAGALWVMGAVAAQIGCIDAARAAVRVAARGDGERSARDAAEQAAPSGSTVSVQRSQGTVSVTVTSVVRPFGGWAGRIHSVRVSSTAIAVDEKSLSTGGSP